LGLHFSFTFDNLPLTNGKHATQFGRGLFQYPFLLFDTYWPWLPLMIAGLAVQVKKMSQQRDSTNSLLVIWVLGVIVPCSLPDSNGCTIACPFFRPLPFSQLSQ